MAESSIRLLAGLETNIFSLLAGGLEIVVGGQGGVGGASGDLVGAVGVSCRTGSCVPVLCLVSM